MLTAFDVGVGVLVLISAILATARGLTREILSLATWAGSAAIAVYMYFQPPKVIADFAMQHIADERVRSIAIVVVTFIVALIVLHLLTMRIADFVVDSKIGPLDRTLGFVFGVLRGLLIAVVITIFGTWLLADRMPPWAKDSQSMPQLQAMGNTLIGMLPPNLQKQVEDALKGKAVDESPGPADAGVPDDNQTDSTEDSTPPGTVPAAPATTAPATAAPAAPAANPA